MDLTDLAIEPITDEKTVFNELLSSNLDFENNRATFAIRHNWHSFPAKYPAELPALFIKNLTKKNQIVLDPMAGSCTTLIESAFLERISYGFDIDPLSLLLVKAKLSNFEVLEAKKIGINVLENAKKTFENNALGLNEELKKRFDDETQKFIDYWFLADTQKELLALLLEIEKIELPSIQSILKLVFSGIIITKSGGVTLGYDLAHTRPHKVATKTPNSAFGEFGKKLNKTLNFYQNLPEIDISLVEANAQKMPLDDNCIDLIITSPPYANNAIDYMRAHKFSLVWFGHKISELKNIRKNYISSETILKNNSTQLPEFCQKIIAQLMLHHQNKAKALLRYYSEMQIVISEMYRVLKPQRACVIVVATSVLKGVDVETQHCLAEIGKSIGFELIKIGQRNIDRNKRMLPTSHTKTNSQIETRMHQEFIIGFWKP
ncbi:MAG: site-specific DNA-methyltransferase [Microscillaceae bacterium]|jgi:DNA modification methylase|nr:site-specific DNA-methyltransferase [Microscillaceae bacterium]